MDVVFDSESKGGIFDSPFGGDVWDFFFNRQSRKFHVHWASFLRFSLQQ